MWSNLLSAALLYGVLSTTFVASQTTNNQATFTPPLSTSTETGPVGPVQQPTGSPQQVATALKGGESNGIETEKSGATGGPVAPSSTPDRSPENTTSGARQSAGNSVAASPGKSNNTGAIAGGVVGGVLFLVLVGALIFFLRKRKKARDPFGSMEKSGESSSTLSRSLIAY